MALPERQNDWRAHVPVALDLARRIGCETLHALVGVERRDQREAQLAWAAVELAFAADAAAEQGATVVVEALNPDDNGPRAAADERGRGRVRVARRRGRTPACSSTPTTRR